MTCTAGIDVGSTYTKAVILDPDKRILGRAVARTGFRFPEIAEKTYRAALSEADVRDEEIGYVVATGFGRHQVSFRDLHVTDVTAGRQKSCERPSISLATLATATWTG